jgi:hypothetical protein
MKVTEINIPNKPIQPEAQDTTMAQNQLLKIGQQAIKIENMIANNQEISEWASNKINLVSEYVKKVHGYIQNEKAPPGREDQVKALKGKVDNPYAVAWASHNKSKTEDDGKPIMRDPLDSEQAKNMQRDKDRMIFRGREIDQNSIEYEMEDYSDMIFELHRANYIDGTELDEKELEELEGTDELQEWVRIDYVSESATEDAGENEIIQWAKKYSQYKNLEDDNLIEALYQYAFDLGITQFIFEVGELQAAERELGKKQEDWEDKELGAALEMSPISDGLLDELHKLIPGDDLEDKLNKIKPMLEKAGLKEDGMTSADVDRVKNQHFTDQQIKQAYSVLNHPSVKGGNYTAAYNIINKIAPGLADHPDVANALRRANESLNEEQSVRVKTDVHGEWGGHRGKVLDKDDDENWLVGFGNEAEWFKQEDLEFQDDDYENDPDTDGEVATLDPEFEEDAGTSPLKETVRMVIELVELLKNGGSIDESTQNILNQAADNLHGVYHYESYANTNRYREELDSNTLNKHAGVIQKGIDNILATETPIDDIDTKPGMLRILSKKVNEVEKEMAKEVRENMTYEDMLQNRLDKSMQEYDTPEKKAERDALMQKYLKKGGKIEKVPTGKTAYKNKELKPAYRKDNGTPTTSPGSDESAIKEDGAPFGSGMELLRMAIMRKFITVQEWDLLKHKWRAAADEVEEKYSDWPEGEGFGSSDHNFAIRDLMSAVGYEFDDQDTSGRFVVIKQPEEIEKAGIKNVRMQGEPVATEERQEGFAVRYSLDGKRKAQAYRSEKDAQHRAEILRSMGGVKDVSITKHTLNFKKESAYESKLARMLNQQLK